jgi:hypothetical protein
MLSNYINKHLLPSLWRFGPWICTLGNSSNEHNSSIHFQIKCKRNNNLAHCLLNFNKLSFNNGSFNYFIHSSAILNSDPRNPVPINLDATESQNSRSPILGALARLENERISDLQLINIKKLM